MDLEILDYTLHITKMRDAYNTIRKTYQAAADQAEKQFRQIYQEENQSLEDVVKNAQAQFVRCIAPVLDMSIDQLISLHVQTIDRKRFLDQYGSYIDEFSEPFEEIQDKYMEIVCTEEELDEYRRQRRLNRGRVVGGGFGLSGAVQGMATAGALNLAAGAAHAVFNGIAKIGSSIKASNKMRRIFKDDETLDTLACGVWRSAFLCHRALIHCVDAHMHMGLDASVSEDAQEEAAAILENAYHRIKDEEEQQEAFIKSLNRNPYAPKWYRYALEVFFDEDGSIEAAADYFGMNRNGEIRAYKQTLLNAAGEDLTYQDEAGALQAKEELEKYCKLFHYEGTLEKMRKIQEDLIRFDLEARSVDGIVFDAREEASAAREELAQIQTIMQETDEWDIASLALAQDKLKEFRTPIAVKYQQRADDLYCVVDLWLRTVDGMEFPDRMESAAARREFQKIQKAMREVDRENIHALRCVQCEINACVTPIAEKYKKEIETVCAEAEQTLRVVDLKIDGQTLQTDSAEAAQPIREDVNKAYALIKDLEESEEAVQAAVKTLSEMGLCSEVLQPYLQYLSFRLSVIDKEKRTVFGMVYATREDAAKAEAYFEFLQEEIQKTNQRSATEWNILQQQVNTANLSDQAKKELSQLLYRGKHHKMLAFKKTVKDVLGMVVGILIIYFLFKWIF
ncbi:MAG: hypothetical protein ACI3V2_06640 [Faecousia sp.]